MAKKINEKLSIEKNREHGSILLFLEGGFYRAYEHSAFEAIKNLHAFKVSCRYYKAVESRVACIGFPVTSLAKFANGNKVEQHDDMAVIKLSEGFQITSDDEFTAWKEALPTTEDSNGPIPSCKQRTEIYQKVMSFPIENRTPLQCMIFLAEIKSELMSDKKIVDNGTL